MSNKNVQNAAASVITEGARQAMNNGTTGYGSPGRFWWKKIDWNHCKIKFIQILFNLRIYWQTFSLTNL